MTSKEGSTRILDHLMRVPASYSSFCSLVSKISIANLYLYTYLLPIMTNFAPTSPPRHQSNNLPNQHYCWINVRYPKKICRGSRKSPVFLKHLFAHQGTNQLKVFQHVLIKNQDFCADITGLLNLLY